MELMLLKESLKSMKMVDGESYVTIALQMLQLLQSVGSYDLVCQFCTMVMLW